MPAQTPAGLAGQDQPRPAVQARLGYLLKHAQQRLTEFTAPALAPFGITGRELAVLMSIDDLVPLSQQDVADRLGVDRTTMVTLIDGLEDKELVVRRPDAEDRRRNVVVLTGAGQATMAEAVEAASAAEQQFLSKLSAAEVATLKAALQALTF
ncbi:MAG TPA: MarR family transcriptional regulator [Streptosporangiaceae bacterium]